MPFRSRNGGVPLQAMWKKIEEAEDFVEEEVRVAVESRNKGW